MLLFGVFVVTSSKAFILFHCALFAEDYLVLCGEEQFSGPVGYFSLGSKQLDICNLPELLLGTLYYYGNSTTQEPLRWSRSTSWAGDQDTKLMDCPRVDDSIAGNIVWSCIFSEVLEKLFLRLMRKGAVFLCTGEGCSSVRFFSEVSQSLKTRTKEMKFDLVSTCFVKDGGTPYTGQKADMTASVPVLESCPAAGSQVFCGGGSRANKPWCSVLARLPWGAAAWGCAGVTLGTDGSSSPSLLAGFWIALQGHLKSQHS